MELEVRLRTIARGQDVATSVAAYARSLEADAELDDDEKAQAEEFLATVEIMFLMAAVDGDIADAETRQLKASIEAITDIHGGPPIRLDRAMIQLAEKLSRDGWSARLRKAAARLRSPDARAFAFRLAAGVAFVDDFVAHAEAAAIDSLAAALGLERSESEEILHEVREMLFG